MLGNLSIGPLQPPLLCYWLSEAKQACYLDYWYVDNGIKLPPCIKLLCNQIIRFVGFFSHLTTVHLLFAQQTNLLSQNFSLIKLSWVVQGTKNPKKPHKLLFQAQCKTIKAQRIYIFCSDHSAALFSKHCYAHTKTDKSPYRRLSSFLWRTPPLCMNS